MNNQPLKLTNKERRELEHLRNLQQEKQAKETKQRKEEWEANNKEAWFYVILFLGLSLFFLIGSTAVKIEEKISWKSSWGIIIFISSLSTIFFLYLVYFLWNDKYQG